MNWVKRRWGEVVVVGLAEAGVASLATALVRIVVDERLVRDIGVAAIWPAAILAGAWYVRRPKQEAHDLSSLTTQVQEQARASQAAVAAGRGNARLAAELEEQRQLIRHHYTELEKIIGPRPGDEHTLSKSWQVEVHGVLWETDGSREKNDRLRVKGPFCPAPCLAPLAYSDASDMWDLDPGSHVLGGRYAGELYCPVCKKAYGDLGASESPDREVSLSVYRSSAATHLEALIRREKAGI